MRSFWVACLICVFAPAAAQARGLPAPGLQSPANGAWVQSLPAFTWGGVNGGVQYEFEFAAERGFSSGVNGFGSEGYFLSSTAVSNDRTIPNGTYYWRVRAVSAKDVPGAWSRVRTLHKAWSTPPQLQSPANGGTVSWPTIPLVFRWSAVPYATNYDVWLATDPGLSNIVWGSVSNPQNTQATVLAYPSALPPGQYYWAVTPVDAEGDRGPRSAISSFIWTWPSTTSPVETNTATAAGVVDPQFSWSSVPGAVGYQVEVNASQNFPVGSRWCCNGIAPGTTLSPTTLLANGTYYWRVRAIDVNGDAGVWNLGQSFTESFDVGIPSIQNLQLMNSTDSAPLGVGSPTNTPIITWDPVPGASSYEAQVTAYRNGFGCDWSGPAINQDITTAATAWTPLSPNFPQVGPSAWPTPQHAPNGLGIGSYCFRVLARRDDGAQNGQIISDWTQLGGANAPAFDFTGAPTSNAPPQQTTNQYLLPAEGSTTPRTPLFVWNPVPGANGYYVVVARDQYFTDVIDVGYTNVPAYAPQKGNEAPYADETTAYWWAVLPTTNPDGTGQFYADPGGGEDHPQYFDKSSTPPTPVSPTTGSTVLTQPSFTWTSAETERNYQIQVATDPSFSDPLVDTTTDSTSYTTTATLPADTTLYWRVRANDAIQQGLNWSTIATFMHHLPPPRPAADATGGSTIPLLSWTPVPGAITYDMHVDQADGTTKDFNGLDSPDMTPTQWYGTGIWRWQVRADFPGSNASSAYFTPEMQFVRSIPAPGGVSATKSGTRIIISWKPTSYAYHYQVQLSTTPGFASPVASDTTDNSVWAPQIQPTQATQTLYWRVAVVDVGGNVGAYDTGVFRTAKPKRKPKPKPKRCIKHRGKRCIKYA